MTEIAVLAVTRLSSGVCVAGIAENGEWVRPTRPSQSGWRQLDYSDCRDSNGNWVVQKGCVVKMDLREAIPTGEHSEDWLVGDRKVQLVRELSEEGYLAFCQNHQESSLDPLMGIKASGSLILICPEKFTSFTFQVETSLEGKRNYVPRCGFVFNGQYYLRKPISDAEWRGYGRRYLQKTDNPKVGDIFAENQTKNCWLTIGRNIVNSNIYLIVVGIHLFPVRRFKMDFKRV